MKKFILLFTLATFHVLPSIAQDSDSTVFFQKILGSIKEKNLASFQKLSINVAEFGKLIDASSFTKEQKEQTKSMVTQEYMDERYIKDFNKIISNAGEYIYKIDWNTIKIDSTIYKSKVEFGISRLRIKFYFTFNDVPYFISVRECVKTTSGWKMTDGASLYKREE